MGERFDEMTPDKWAEIEKKDTIKVSYDGLLVEIRPAALDDAIKRLEERPRAERRDVLRSVNRELDRFVKLFQSQPDAITETQRQNFCNDVCLWFAEMVRKGEHHQYFQHVSEGQRKGH